MKSPTRRNWTSTSGPLRSQPGERAGWLLEVRPAVASPSKPSIPPKRRARKAARAAITLMELLLVLALAVAILAAAMPAFRATFRQQRLEKAAEQIRAEWSRARNRAIKTGQTQVFRYVVGSREYLTVPQVSYEDLVESDLGIQMMERSTSRNVDPFAASASDTTRELPEDVFFVGSDVQFDQRSAVALSNLESGGGMMNGGMTGMPMMNNLSPMSSTGSPGFGQSWGMPVFFFPDGTTSTAYLVLANDRQRTISVYLRGLSGMSRVGPVQIDPNTQLREAMNQ